MDICGNPAIFLPHTECNECESLSDRIRVLENMLAGKTDITITKTDANGTIIATVLGTAEEA